MRRFRNRAVFAILGWFLWNTALGQGVQSPYSIQGIGELVSPALVTNISMGGLGISAASIWNLNNMNPALLARNTFSSFDMSISANLKTVATEETSQRLTGGALDYVVLGIPVIPSRWTLSSGLQKYSHVSFNLVSIDSLSAEDVRIATSFIGTGGLNQFYISNGLQVTKNLLLGVKGSYLFGPVENERIIRIEGDNTHTAFVDRVTFSDVQLGLGAVFIQELKNDILLNLGAIYDMGIDLRAKRSQFKETRIANDVAVYTDTILYKNQGNVGLPAKYGVGLSLEKTNRWLAGIEFAVQNWSEYRTFEGNQEVMANSYKIAVGGQFVPDAASVNSYLKRMTYRMGFNFKQTPFLWQDQNVNEVGVSLGFSLPLRGYSNLNLGAEFGRRGDLSQGQIEERYTRIYFGVSFNDRPWQKRPIYD